MAQANPADVIVEQMDDLLENGDLSTKNGLRFAFTVLRQALTVVNQMEKRVIEAENAYVGLSKTTSEQSTRFEKYAQKTDTMWTGYRILVWVSSAFGLSVIAAIWSLITGQATITFAR